MDKVQEFKPKSPAAEKFSVLHRMAMKYGMDPGRFEQTLMGTIIPSGKASREQVAALLLVADRHNLDPWTKEIYAFPGKGGGVVPIVGVDGWVTLCNRNEQYDGLQFEYTEGEWRGKPAIVAVLCRIFRKDRTRPIEVTEYLDECYRDTEPWNRWPRRQLRHKALIQCARVAFGFSGIFDPDEAERIRESELAEDERTIEVEAKVTTTPKKKATSVDDLVPPEQASEPEGMPAGPEVMFDDLAQHEDPA